MMERESRQSKIYRFRLGWGVGLVHGHGHVYVEGGKVDGKGVWR
jgi:cytolysin (calcineurin-like family phosphatase)